MDINNNSDKNNTSKDNQIIKKQRDFVLNDNQSKLIKETIINLLDVESVLNLVNPKLKQLYLDRCSEEYFTLNKSKSNNIPALGKCNINL